MPPHRCYRADRCPDRELVDGTHLGRHINPERGLCDTCARHVTRALGALPADYTNLNLLLGAGSTAGGEPVRMTRERPIPLRGHVDALQREIVAEARLWAASVAAVLGIDWRPRADVRHGWALDRACRLLARSPSALLALHDEHHTLWDHGRYTTRVRDGLDGALVLLELHHRARRYTGQTRLVHHLPVPCPRCESMGLTREDGSDTIVCRDCGRAYTWAEYEKLCTILAAREVAA